MRRKVLFHFCALALAVFSVGCDCSPAAPIELLPDGSVGLPVPAENNVYQCRCICEVPIEHTAACAPWAPERNGRAGGPNDGNLICELERTENVCFPPELNPNHESSPDPTRGPATNAELFAHCRDQVRVVIEEGLRDYYYGCGRPNPDGTCPSSVCTITCDCGPVLADSNVVTSNDAKCNSDCPPVPLTQDPDTLEWNINEATFVPAPNIPECPIAADTPLFCTPPRIDPPDEPPDGLFSAFFGPARRPITLGRGTITINDEASIPTTVEGSARFGAGVEMGESTIPLSLAVRVADVTLPGRGVLSDMTLHGAVVPPGVAIGADGRAELAPETFLATVRGTGSKEVGGVTYSDTRAYFVPNPAPMSLAVDSRARTFTLSSVFEATLDAETTARFQMMLGGVLDALPPLADAGPHRSVECTSSAGAEVLLDASGSSDADGDLVAYQWAAEAASGPHVLGGTPLLRVFQPIGTRRYGLLVSDARLQIAQDTVSIEVADTAGPSLTVQAEPSCLWSPNHEIVRLQLGEELTFEVSDACSGETPTVRVVSVTSDQPDDALGDGRTTDDALFGPSGACLRAERGAVGGAQRTYTITLEARDASGNVTRQDVHVVVPHDQRDRCPTAEAEALSEEQVEALCVFPEVPGVTEPVELPAAVAPEPVDAGVLTSRPARMHGGCAVGGAGPREPWLVAAVLGLALARRRRAVR